MAMIQTERIYWVYPTPSHNPLNCENFIKTTTLGDKLKMLYPSGSFGISLMNQLEAKIA